jgi:phosphatidylinositol alpha-1,6-mannosyltransferase
MMGEMALRYPGEQLPQFERLARELGIGETVRFLGAVPDAELPALYNATDLYVGASRRVELLAEGFGISLVEASACGLAVVGGRSGGVPDAVRDGETGILVDPDDPAAVAAGVNELLANPERRRQLGAAGRKAVEAYYNWDRVVADLIRIDAAYRLPDRPAAR